MALQTRPPVITIMGHVDHGKTSLLDYIRKSKITAKEAGGITQHIGAYQIDFKGTELTFIDTPGHAAFNKMRERGADITDIVILVVAANDGVKPQTIESIRHIKKSKAATVVAINKTDLPDVYPDMVKAQLAEHDLLVQGFGGDIESVEISAKTGKGVDKLLETLVVMAELMELKADPEAPLEAVVIEASKDPQRGTSASVIVQQGTLAIRQDLLVDGALGRVKRLNDDLGKSISEAKPGDPVELIGLKDVPAVGSIVKDANAEYPQVVETPEETPVVAENEDPYADLDFDAIFGEKPKLKLIVKADVEGTLEAIKQNLDEESVELIDSGVGEVTERDVDYAKTTGARILTFHTKVPGRIKKIAKAAGVKIKAYDVIYKLIEDLQKQMLKLMDSTIDEVVTGEAEIQQIFEMRGDIIAGSKVKTGEIKKTDKIHLLRNGEIVMDLTPKNMMHGKEDITSAKAKSEFGMTFRNKKADFKVGDILQAYYSEDDLDE